MSHTVLQVVLNTFVRGQFPRLLRRVGLVVRTSDSGSDVAGSSPDEGNTNAMRNILEQGVYSHGLRSTKPFILLGSINWYQPRLGVNSSCDSRCDGID